MRAFENKEEQTVLFYFISSSQGFKQALKHGLLKNFLNSLMLPICS